MNDEEKQHIVTKIEKYNDIIMDSGASIYVDYLCAMMMIIIHKIHFIGLSDDIDMVANQILNDICFFGITGASLDFIIQCIKALYLTLGNHILIKKRNDYNKLEELTNEENNEGKIR